jgi:hypothetical protein
MRHLALPEDYLFLLLTSRKAYNNYLYNRNCGDQDIAVRYRWSIPKVYRDYHISN